MLQKFLLASFFINILLLWSVFYFFFGSWNELFKDKDIAVWSEVYSDQDIPITNGSTKFLEEQSGSLYLALLDVASSQEAINDWNIINNLFMEQNCEENLDEYNTNICNLYKKNDLEWLRNFQYLEAEHKLIILSLASWENLCEGSKECNFYYNIVEDIRWKKIRFPVSIDDSRHIEFFAYQKLFPETYQSELQQLFMKTQPSSENE